MKDLRDLHAWIGVTVARLVPALVVLTPAINLEKQRTAPKEVSELAGVSWINYEVHAVLHKWPR